MKSTNSCVCVLCSTRVVSLLSAQLRSQVGEGRCLALDCSEKAKDQAVRVLRHFNVQATPSDIFSRCQVRKQRVSYDKQVKEVSTRTSMSERKPVDDGSVSVL